MKAYLIITGSLFGLMAFLHVWKAIDEWHQLTSHPAYFVSMVALGGVAAALAVWAVRLLKRMSQA